MALDSDFWVDLKKGESPIRIWDKLTLGGITFPGIAGVECSVGLDLEVAKYQTRLPAGTQPAQFQIGLVDKGYAPGDVRAFIQVWTLDQWEDLKETLPKFSPRSGDKQGSALGGTPNNPSAKTANAKGRDAFDISHPATALLGISSVIVKKISLPMIMDQTLIVTMDMIQYFPQAGVRVLHSSGGAINAADFDTPAPGRNTTP